MKYLKIILSGLICALSIILIGLGIKYYKYMYTNSYTAIEQNNILAQSFSIYGIGLLIISIIVYDH